MSFSSEQKNYIINEQIKNVCCRNALIRGILSSKARVEKSLVEFNVENDHGAAFCKKLILEFFGREADVLKGEKGGRMRRVRFESKSAAKYVLNIKNCNDLFVEKCSGCLSCFLKGFFFGCGNLCDPKNQYYLDFSPINNIKLFNDFLESHTLSPKMTVRRGREIIYFRKAGDIEDFLGLAGLNNAVFELANVEIEGEILNNTNRIVNCETGNIEKSVKASGKQVEIIKELIANDLLSTLPDELEYTARLRIEFETLSLSQLSKKFTPPISKSGLSHRLNKIIELGTQLLKG